MNDTQSRSPLEVFCFVLAAAGALTGAAGIITDSIPASIAGALMIFIALAYFASRGD